MAGQVLEVGCACMYAVVCELQQGCPSSTTSFRSSLTNHAATDKNRRAHPTPCHPSPNHTIPHHTTPAAAESLPDVLVRKLKPGGRMVIPVGPQWEYQVCLLGIWWGRTGQGEFTGGHATCGLGRRGAGNRQLVWVCTGMWERVRLAGAARVCVAAQLQLCRSLFAWPAASWRCPPGCPRRCCPAVPAHRSALRRMSMPARPSAPRSMPAHAPLGLQVMQCVDKDLDGNVQV